MPESTWTVAPEDAGVRLDKFLAHATRLGSRARAATAIDRGKAYVNETLNTDPATRLVAHDAVRLWMDKPGSSRRPLRPGHRGPLDILYEDDVLIVANKPAGLLSVPLERKRDVPSIFDQIEQYL